MDPHRQDCLRPVVKALRSSRRAGMIYLAPDGRKMDSAYAWPWPDPGGDRDAVLRLVVEQLEKSQGVWRLGYVEEGVSKSRAFASLWPEQAGLFEFLPGQEVPAWPAWAFEEEGHQEAPQPPVVLQGRVRVEQSGELRIVREVEESEALCEDCAEDVVRVIAAAQRRLSVGEVCDELSRRSLTWSANLVASTCQALRESGRLSSRRDAKGKGLGLPEWAGPS